MLGMSAGSQMSNDSRFPTSTISCYLYVEGGERPELYISAPSMKFIGDIGAAFDLDMYHFS
jgi:hypothetical protein